MPQPTHSATSRADQWPKIPPPLSDEQKIAREKFMLLWHEEIPSKYAIIEKFNHGYVASLDLPPNCRTLEIGAGLGGHLPYENLEKQDYHVLEYRSSFCEELKSKIAPDRVHCGDIQTRQGFADASFDRVVAIHVLEHLPNLPSALSEIARILKPTGVFDVVIPCEGGFAHTFARKISAERLFRKNFKMDFNPIHKNEHVNTFPEIYEQLKLRFRCETSRFFPLRLPVATMNLCAGFRWKPK